jgi:hypothetical protein
LLDESLIFINFPNSNFKGINTAIVMKKYILPLVIFTALSFQAFAQNFHINEDFNAGSLPTGWSNDTLGGSYGWEFGLDGSSLDAGNNNLDGTNFVYFDDDAIGSAESGNHVELVTPSFDNSTEPITYLEFDYNFRQYGAINDSFYVDVFDGSSWVRVYSVWQDDCGNYTATSCNTNFPHANIDISSYANANCQVRFGYFDGNGSGPFDYGWYVGVDNIQVQSPFPNDVGVVAFDGPISGCGLGNETVAVYLTNFGTQTTSTFDVSYTVNGGTPVTETVNAALTYQDTLRHAFSTLANLSTVGSYNIQAYTTLSTDSEPTNDSASFVVENEPVFTPIFTEDFEANNGGWSVEGRNPSWEWGVPQTANMNTAASGQRAWITDLNGSYNPNERSYLVSPCFDFSASVGDPIMTFSLNRRLETGYDFAWMEYSLNNGLTWVKLFGSANSSNWYNNATNFTWDGSTTGWVGVENALLGLAGEPQVKFRFVINADPSTQLEGIGFDLFSIRDPQPVDMSLNQLLYPSQGNAPICGYGSAENIIIELENKGANAISSFDVSYQVDNGPIYTETVNVNMLPNTQYTYSFTNKYNFSALRNYIIDVWVTAPSDGFGPNDTIANRTIRNTQNVTPTVIPYYEDFSSFNNVNDGGWQASPTSANQFNFGWYLGIGPSAGFNTGPSQGNSTPGYVYMPRSTGTNATYSSPCFDLSNNQGAAMTFFTHRYGSTMLPTYVDVYDGSGWVNVAAINTTPQNAKTDPWTEHEINLNAYAGRRIKVRFRGDANCCTGEMAIDDVILYEPLEWNANMLGPIAPYIGCEVNDQSVITVEVRNDGSRTILPDSMMVYYQVEGQPAVGEPFDKVLNNEEVKSYTFNQTADLSIPDKQYNIKSWVSLPRDQYIANDTVPYYRAYNDTKYTNYFEDFETARDASQTEYFGQVLSNGWVADYTPYAWNVQSSLWGKGANLTPQGGTGPAGDHTTGNGMFLYTANTNMPQGANVAVLTSPCIDLTQNTEAKMSFWYHKYGNQMGNLFVDLLDNNGVWVTEHSINGATQNAAEDAWKLATVDISGYVGQYTQIRIRGTNGGARGNMAIDDIFVFDPVSYDIGVTDIPSPSGNSCNLSSTATVSSTIQNLGNLDLPANSIEIRYTVNRSQLAIDTISSALLAGNTLTHTFSQTADLTAGGNQNIKVSVDLIGLTDSIRVNNSSEKTVINRKIGFPYYFQDFETFGMGAGGYPGDDLQGWSRNPNGFGHTWHVWQGPAPTIDGEPMPPPPIEANGPSGDHTFATPGQNGNGIYMLVETKFRSGGIPDAELTTPCNGIDFTQSKNDKIMLSFWYHMFGNTGDLFIDVHNGTQWINGVSVIRGQQQLKATDPWEEWQVSLDNFSHVSNAQIRFRADYLGNLGGGDIGLDDVAILDRDTIDASITEFKRPESDCNKANNEEVRVRVQNTGTQDIYRLDMGYQVTFTPLNGPKVIYPIVQEFDVVTIIPLAKYTYNFTDRVDMTDPGKYEFKIWTEVNGDFYEFNDTLKRTIYNETLPFPYCVDFSELLYGDIAKDFLDEKLRNNWVGNQAAYSFKASMGGPPGSGLGGPISGNTSGINDIYMLLEDADGMPPQQGWIRTPCFDLTNTRAANLDFYYMATNRDHYLEIQISNDAANWQDLDTLYGPPAVEEWNPVSIVLADYVGQIVYFRFRGSNVGGGFYAIDDVCVVSPPPQQIELERIIAPPKGFCYYSGAEEVRLRVQNVGVDRIDSFQVRLHVDRDNVKFPIGQHFSDTFMVYPTNPTLEPGDKLDLTLPNTIDMSAQTTYFISAYITLPGDLDTTNNFRLNEEWVHPVPLQIPYVIDFEDQGDPLNRLLYGAGGSGDYIGELGQGMNVFGETGPADDHTFQNNTGHYFVTNSAAGRGGDFVVLQSECIDLSQTVQPELQYWYHRFGTQQSMGNFYVQINDDYGWVTVDSLIGTFQANNSRPWELRQVDLGAYAGDFVKFRMISFYGGGSFGNMGIDDIFLFDLSSKDAAPAGLEYPNEHIYSCYTDTQTVWVNIRNNGADSLDFEGADTVHFEVLIEKDGQPWDTLYRTLSTHLWPNPVKGGVLDPLPRDTVEKVLMDGSFDMSEIGAMFDFEVRVNMITDVLRRNDTADYSVFTRRETGYIPIDSILPNDTVCYGSPVQLKVKDFFGKLKWQVRELDKNGNGFWFDGFTFPNDDSSYSQVFDTTTEVRVQVCQVEETDTVKVDISKPYSGKALNASRCGIGPISVAVEFPYKGAGNYENIDSVFIFDFANADSNDVYIESGEPYLSNGKLRYDLIFDSSYVVGGNFMSVLPDSAFLTASDSILLDTAIVFKHSLWVKTKSDSCWSPVMTKVTATINNNPRIPVDTIAGDTVRVCQDTAYVLNAGAYDERQFSYKWIIVNPDGSIDTSYNQVQLIDAWKLEKNSLFKYTIEVESDSACISALNGPNDTIYVQIVDSCVTSIEEYKFGDEFTIYPNPTNNQVYVEYRSLNDLVGTVKLMSMDGKLIEQHSNVNFRQQTTRFDLGQYAKGIYFIKIETPDGVVVRKIVRS